MHLLDLLQVPPRYPLHLHLQRETITTINSLPTGKFRLLLCRLILFNITFSKSFFRNTIRVSNILDPDQVQRFVGPDLGQICSQRLSAEYTIGKELERRSSLQPLKFFSCSAHFMPALDIFFLYLTRVWLVIIMNLKKHEKSLKAILS